MSRRWVGMSRGWVCLEGWICPVELGMSMDGYVQRLGTHPRDMGPQEGDEWEVRIPLECCLVVHEL